MRAVFILLIRELIEFSFRKVNAVALTVGCFRSICPIARPLRI